MKKNERIIVIALVIIAIIAYGVFMIYRMNNQSEIIEVVKHFDDGSEEVLFEFDVNIDDVYTFDVDLGQMTITVEDGTYRVSEVDCPQHICEKMGAVSSEDVANIIICMPNGISIGPKGE